MKRRDRNTPSDRQTAPFRLLGRTAQEWRGLWEAFFRFCYVVGIRSIRCVKAIGRFTRGLWRPLMSGLYRAADRLLLRYCRKLAAEWRALRADFARAHERVQGVEKGKKRQRLHEMVTLAVLAVQRHRAMFRTMLNLAAPVAAVAVLIGTIWYWRQAHFALALEYDGEPMGYIANESTYNTAAAAVQNMVIDADDSFNVQRSPRMVLAMVSPAELLDEQALSDRILNSVSASLAQTSGLYVDGMFRGALPRDTLERLMSEALVRRDPEQSETMSFFAQIEIVDGLYPVSAVSSEAEIAAYLDTLSVQISRFITYTETVKYETITTWNEAQPLGFEEVLVQGRDGEQRVTVEIITVDGVEQYRSVVSATTITAPVNRVIVKGGHTYSDDAVAGDGVATGKFVWPLPYTKVISSPFASRWGSFHGAIDISNGRVNGKPIIASDGGTVAEAGWHNSYGYYVLIDHGNGFKTRYAHCSALNVTAGQKVAQGEYIAAVGNTGYSFGAHLHFEVILNGQLVDPMNYVEY